MRNLDNGRSSPRRVRPAGFTRSTGYPQEQQGTDPERHFTDVATNMRTPERVTVDLTPYGEREVLDTRD